MKIIKMPESNGEKRKIREKFEEKTMQSYQRISSLLPRKIKEAFKKQLDYLGIEVSETRFVGFLFSFGIILDTLDIFDKSSYLKGK